MSKLSTCVSAAALIWFTGCRCCPAPSTTPDFGFPVENLPTEKDKQHTGWGAVPVYDNQMMWVKNHHETALIHFTKFEGDHAWYRYRLYNYTTGEETRGTGEVFEKFEVVERTKTATGTSTKVRDAGSQTHLKPGTFDIGWSKSSNNQGWIYLGPKFWDLRILDASQFEKFPFRTNRPQFQPAPEQ
jgi:hypothetical protein